VAEFLGLAKLENQRKQQLFDLLYYYLLMRSQLRDKLGLAFRPSQLSGVVGLLAKRTSQLDRAAELGELLCSRPAIEWTDWLEEFDFNSLDGLVADAQACWEELAKVSAVSWWIKMLVWVRYGDWRRFIYAVAKLVLAVFVFLSLLYILVATDWGRNWAWSFLDVYSVVVRWLLIVLLVVALVLIVGFVSFMYFEGKAKKKQ
jgi:hypothetical protein